MGIFDKRKSISRRELESFFRRDSGIIPRTGGKRYSMREREKMTKEAFGSEYGSIISKQEYKRAVRKLGSAQKEAKSREERAKKDEPVRYYKERGGRDIR